MDVRRINYLFIFSFSECQTKASLTAIGASSVYQNNEALWGPKLALTELSKTSTGYWHSAAGDTKPWIKLGMDGLKKVDEVTVVDRLDGANHRFKNVEVSVGTSEKYVSCGTQSYQTGHNLTYKYVVSSVE